MVELLQGSGNGNTYEAMERVVAKKNMNVYLEAMEESEKYNESSLICRYTHQARNKMIMTAEFSATLV